MFECVKKWKKYGRFGMELRDFTLILQKDI